jgi:hypothetical protein
MASLHGLLAVIAEALTAANDNLKQAITLSNQISALHGQVPTQPVQVIPPAPVLQPTPVTPTPTPVVIVPVTTYTTTTPAVTPTPVITPPYTAPAPVGFEVFEVENIHGTCWLTAGDFRKTQTLAYDEAKAGTLPPDYGRVHAGCALPCRSKWGTYIEAQRDDGSWTPAIPQLDVGPWNTDDPYWTAGSRPQAETGTNRHGESTNKAGIDLTPLAASWLTGQPLDICYSREISYTVKRIRIYVPCTVSDRLLSLHFSQKEAEHSATADAQHIDNSLPEALIENAKAFAAKILEPIRQFYGPFSPNSWYRSPALNAVTSGASPTSAHTRALAADVVRNLSMWSAIISAINFGLLPNCLVQVEGNHYHVALTTDKPTKLTYYNASAESWEQGFPAGGTV